MPFDEVLRSEIRKAVLAALGGKEFKWDGLGEAIRSEILDKVLGGTGLNSDLQSKLKEVFKKGALDAESARDALFAWASKQVGEDAIVQKLLEQLDTGTLLNRATGGQAIIELAKVWMNRQVKDEKIKDFLGLILSGEAPDSKAIWPAVRKRLEDAHADGKILAALDSAVAGNFGTKKLLELVAGYASSAGSSELSDVLNDIAAGTAPQEAVTAAMTAWIRKQVPNEIEALFEKAAARDWLGILQMAIGKLKLDAYSDVIMAFAQGKPLEGLETLLVQALEARGVGDNSADLASALISLLKGDISLFAVVNGDAGDLAGDPNDLRIWRKLKPCFLVAQAFATGDFLGVSADAQARPQLLTLAAINANTTLDKLVSDPSVQANREAYSRSLTLVVKAEFHDELTQSFLKSTGDLLSQKLYAEGTKATCRLAATTVHANSKEN